MWCEFTNSRLRHQRLSNTQFFQQSGVFLMWRHSLPKQREQFHLRRSLQQLYRAGGRRREWKKEKIAGRKWLRLRFLHILSRCWSFFIERTRKWSRFEDLTWFLPVCLSRWLIYLLSRFVSFVKFVPSVRSRSFSRQCQWCPVQIRLSSQFRRTRCESSGVRIGEGGGVGVKSLSYEPSLVCSVPALSSSL